MRQHANVGLHPRMLIALDRDQSLRTAELLLDRRGALRLHLIPLLVPLRRGVNIMRGGVAVSNLERLVGLNAYHPRMVSAALLIESYWIGRRRESELVHRTAGHIDK